ASIDAGWHSRPIRAPAEMPGVATVESRKRSSPERTRDTPYPPTRGRYHAIIPAVPLSATTRHNLRRLHSLSGVLPVGLFLLEHFYTNSYAMFGAEVYNEKVLFLTSLPYVPRYSYFRNWMYTLQRASGIFLLVFIALHVYKARLSGAAPDEMFQ